MYQMIEILSLDSSLSRSKRYTSEVGRVLGLLSIFMCKLTERNVCVAVLVKRKGERVSLSYLYDPHKPSDDSLLLSL